jgi:hypothetical protein
VRWQRGANEIDALLAAGQLERCEASDDEARRLLAEGRQHLDQLTSTDDGEPAARYRLAFRAMASSASALLAAEGLRQTEVGGIVAVQRAIDAQFGGGPGPGVFDALSALSTPPSNALDAAAMDVAVTEAIEAATWAVAFTSRLFDTAILRAFSAT